MRDKEIGFKLACGWIAIATLILVNDFGQIGFVLLMSIVLPIIYLIVKKVITTTEGHYKGAAEDKKELDALSKEAAKHLYATEELFVQECKRRELGDLSKSPAACNIKKAINLTTYNENFKSIESTEEGVIEAYRKGLESMADFEEKQKKLADKVAEVQTRKQYAKLGNDTFEMVKSVRRIKSDEEILQKYCPMIFEVEGAPKQYAIRTSKGAACFQKRKESIPDFFGIYAEEVEEQYLKHTPSKMVYTGATVGGITTGGFHQTKEYNTLEKRRVGYKLVLKTENGKKWAIESVKLSPEIVKKAEYGNDETIQEMIDFSKGTIDVNKSKNKGYLLDWLKEQFK